MALTLLDDPQHWRDLAEEARAMADDMSEGQFKQTMLNIVADYERLAKRCEERLARAKK
jgi:hypothetical protein